MKLNPGVALEAVFPTLIGGSTLLSEVMSCGLVLLVPPNILSKNLLSILQRRFFSMVLDTAIARVLYF